MLVLGSLPEVLVFLWVTLGLAFSPGFLPLIMSRLELCRDWLLVPWSLMVSLSLAYGFSASLDGFPLAVSGVFSGSLPAPLSWSCSVLAVRIPPLRRRFLTHLEFSPWCCLWVVGARACCCGGGFPSLRGGRCFSVSSRQLLGLDSVPLAIPWL